MVGGWWKVQWQPVTGFNIQLLVSCPTAHTFQLMLIMGFAVAATGWVGG